MKVSVAYADANKQLVVELDVPEGSSVKEAVERSGIRFKFPGMELGDKKFGIFGKIVEPDQVLNAGERVEIYRPALGKPPKKERGEAREGADSDAPVRSARAPRAAAPAH